MMEIGGDPAVIAVHPWAPLLLADPSPCLRFLVLTELLGRPESDQEVRELAGLRETDPLVTDLLALQALDGSWKTASSRSRGGTVLNTIQALLRLGYLGFGPEHQSVRRGADYLFSLQAPDGKWPMSGEIEEGDRYRNYSMVPLQTALPLRGLAACGYATDPKAERAYDWLLDQRLPDGAWPSGIASGNFAGVAGYRRLAHSRWGCRSNTTGALICLALHPQRRTGPEAQRALDLLLGRETRDRHALGFEMARVIGAERASGFFTYYARFDAALLLDLCGRAGASLEDERVAGHFAFVSQEQGAYGLWNYGRRPEASRWVTFDLLRSLSRLDQSSDWISLEPRTPFRPSTHSEKRH